ncbi:MAG: hypothetical protein AAFR81_04010 [Chloroflexota bacterium]
MFEAIFTPEVLSMLSVEAPIVFFATVVVGCGTHVLAKALNTIIELAKIVKEISIGQNMALQDAVVTAPRLKPIDTMTD